eukprot:CAMPEP_0169296754 /NCGR_PEP_ID=MMETSP1016-20121227/65312_1 /TAXON_ID=342587 /ORGANISM="Karlodinium micrum, Strain CCMP2283" /LENGTH=106 /DNA_ID=CAMNT_0009388173 /DNA_START=178 /DNA_END=495 /DNA_ORIENTATION=-
MELVNIPSTLKDPEYRYKMPRLISKFEGRGNAMKTCIVNMGDVARALHRPPQYTTKWFGSALGVDSQFVRKGGDGEYCYIISTSSSTSTCVASSAACQRSTCTSRR